MMETATRVASSATLKRWSTAEYERMIETGILGEDDHVELIEGEIVELTSQELAHVMGVKRADRALSRAFGGRGYTLVQSTLRLLGGSLPEPDVVVVPGDVPESDELPTSLSLVVEVASSSLAYDRREKVSLYAKMAIPEYWIVNLVETQLEVHREPIELASGVYGFGYRTRTIYRPGETVSPLEADSALVQVAELFPRPNP